MIQGRKMKLDADVPFSAVSGHEQVALNGLSWINIEAEEFENFGSKTTVT
jgi:hypothetical protein